VDSLPHDLETRDHVGTRRRAHNPRVEPAARHGGREHDDTERLEAQGDPVELGDRVGVTLEVEEDEVVAVAALVDPACKGLDDKLIQDVSFTQVPHSLAALTTLSSAE
jgi:hypothetical protein